ncbi:MAG TPA: protocatechuate 3,4-dioxygenase subunit beta [Rhodopila sp.]|uniref:protocatechuate 3,4-dioxygenase subunit beta n=1 Tax=Rhodopila sp. TaxID=2480087 RepID=UPI002BDBACE8|nr:protocatechuate 3,4-dioxygenase subunit beta [Rhodopila sp.]HVY16490.1 protocatechuate 3,4-dioxygenase subunit beta [Rhodopila sp.]
MSETAPFRPLTADTQPANDTPSYGSTRLRHPNRPPLRIPQTVTETTGPRFDAARFPAMADLSVRNGCQALGERIIVRGRVMDENDRPIPHTMIEIWQANASGRYDHPGDTHDAPLDPNFHGDGRVFTDDDGWYQFISIKPGAYPWRNHANAWRPNHIHYSLFGNGFGQRLVTQMYFPGDPLLALDPIFLSVPDEAARNRLVAGFDLDITSPEWALGYRFDFVLRGRNATPMENT